MRDGICPKCGTASVFAKPAGIGNDLQTHVRTSRMDRAVDFISFICVNCGYFENYIADAGKLAEVTRTWQQIPVTRPRDG